MGRPSRHARPGGRGADRLFGGAGDDSLWTEPAGVTSGPESLTAGLSRTASPGDTCYVPVTWEEALEGSGCDTVATAPPAEPAA